MSEETTAASVARGSFLRQPVESRTEWGKTGFVNAWGGFHSTTDPFAYWRTLRVALHGAKDARFALRFARALWRHRRCDTVDFHHFACTREPYNRRIEADYRWRRVWADRSAKASSPAE